MEKGQEHFSELRRLADTEDFEVVKDYYLSIGDEFDFEIEDEFTFDEDQGAPFTELVQTIQVFLDGEEVYTFERTFEGSYADDGEEWLVEEIDNTIDPDVAAVFEACGIELEEPELPVGGDDVQSLDENE